MPSATVRPHQRGARPQAKLPGTLTPQEFAAQFHRQQQTDTDSSFAQMLQQQVSWPHGFTDSFFLRAAMILYSFGLLSWQTSCSQARCGGKVQFEETVRNDRAGTKCRYHFRCLRCGTRTSPEANGALHGVRSHLWMAWIHFTALCTHNQPWSQIMTTMRSQYGVSSPYHTLGDWLERVQKAMGDYTRAKKMDVIGGKGFVVAWDETAWGRQRAGIMKKPAQQRGRSVHTMKRLPGQTIWKKPAVQTSAGSDKGETRWIWMAVVCGRQASAGKPAEVFTHMSQTKRVAAVLLPVSGKALQGKPRGAQQLKKVIKHHIKPGTKPVTDGWAPSASVVNSLAHFDEHAVVNHSKEWRNEDGYHTNDIESENNRLKTWARRRWGRLPPKCTDEMLMEYVFRVNVGSSFMCVLTAVQHDAGVKSPSVAVPLEFR
ncbi:unnamed protein product [Symbiodinium sp. CCMP2592]|nr:unnamed protein product [Symbiodinium sp. CCMP2592]